MASTIQAVRGMNDILPAETGAWQRLEAALRDLMTRYGYSEIRLPIVERTELFARAIGEVTDIVEKEMYTFVDRSGDSLTLRPEGTAGCVRAAIEQNLLRGQTPRLYYMGPMFRHERPQKGRYRQFHQLGVEAFGLAGPDVDAEQIALSARLLRELGLNGVTLELNSLGSLEARQRYRELLVRYLEPRAEALCPDCRARIHRSPLRVLDCKVESCREATRDAPLLVDFLDEDSALHFEGLQARLRALEIPFVVNPVLVRGLDYYNRTVFEWKTDRLGAQGTVIAGGRYDGLVRQIGGPDTPAVGFAMGLERLLALLELEVGQAAPERPDLFIGPFGEAAAPAALRLAERARDAGIRVSTGPVGGLKQLLKAAERSQARFMLILGEQELAGGELQVKEQGTGEFLLASLATLPERLKAKLDA